jgi:hypothetical protein
MGKDNSSMSHEDWKTFVRLLQKKDGIEVHLLQGEMFDDMQQQIQCIVKGAFLKRLPVEIREE